MIRPGIREYFRLRPPPSHDAESRLAAEVDEEIAFHIEQRVRHLLLLGHTPEEARAEAERRFGTLAGARLTLQRRATAREYHMSVREWIADWRRDIRYSIRSLAKEPLVSLVVIVTLALGIGANATMFGIIDRLLLRGPSYVVKPENVRRLYFTQNSFSGDRTTASTGYARYMAIKNGTQSFDALAIYQPTSERIGTGRDSHEIPVVDSSWELFPLLGVHAYIGRFFNADEDHPPQGANVVVLGYDMWKKEYGGARDVIGKTIKLSKTAYTIIGVAPKGFTGPDLQPVSLWMPISSRENGMDGWATSWCCTGPRVVGRIKVGASAAVAGEQATRAYRAAATVAENKDAASGTVTALPIGYGDDGKETTESAVTRWLGGVAIIVLLVACANVINLLLARAIRRQREVSIRLAMGIPRGRLVRLLLTESLLLSITGASAALVLAWWGGKFIRATLIPGIEWGSPLNVRVLLFSAAIAIAVGVIVGLAPAFESLRHDLTATLRATTRQGGGQRRSTLRESLTVLQAALSLVLLVGAGLFVRSLVRIHQLDLGVDADHVLSMYMSLPAEPRTDTTEASWVAMQKRENVVNQSALERLQSRGDVQGAALALGSPLGNSFGVGLKVPGFDSLPVLAGGGPFISAVSSTYFSTVGTRLIRGRIFNANEGKGTQPVAIINEAMAHALWPNQDALTKCIIIADPKGPCASIVGVVQDVHRSGLREEKSMQYYVPLGQEQGVSGADLLVRPKGDAAAFIPVMRAELFRVAPNANYFSINKLSERLDPQIRPWRLGATLFIAFGILALIISMVGLFSVIAYGVSQRRTELGIRLALGARANTIMALILQNGLRLSIAGILLGILIVLAAGRFIEPLLFDTSARDVRTIAGVAAVLLATTIIACVLPALRARRVNPVEALRAE